MDPFEDLIRVSLVPRVRVRSCPRSRRWDDMRLRLSAHHLLLDPVPNGRLQQQRGHQQQGGGGKTIAVGKAYHHVTQL